jgi:hypothetical protein
MNNSYLFITKKCTDIFGFLSKNIRFLFLAKLPFLYSVDAAPLTLVQVGITKDNLKFLCEKLKLTPEFILYNISLSDENFKVLNEIFDYNCGKNRYALYFGNSTRVIPEKALKFAECPNKVSIFEYKGKFNTYHGAIEHMLRESRLGQRSVYVYGNKYLFQLVTEKNTLITNQILYVYVYTRSNRYEFVPL